MTTVMKREGALTSGGRVVKRWRQYSIIDDGKVTIVHMAPAELAGWNIERVEVQDADEWAGMSAAQIVIYKLESGTTYEACDPGVSEVVISAAAEWLRDHKARSN